MVNYARVGRSQRKLWWRSAAILTCKSIVKLGYRGERLIELTERARTKVGIGWNGEEIVLGGGAEEIEQVGDIG